MPDANEKMRVYKVTRPDVGRERYVIYLGWASIADDEFGGAKVGDQIIV